MIYPNPTTHYIHIAGLKKGVQTLKIYDTLGKEVAAFSNINFNHFGQIRLDLSDLKQGFYYVEVMENSDNKDIQERRQGGGLGYFCKR